MRESNEGCATIPDSDETTFARLVEFLYTGDYNAPQPSRVGDIQPEDHRNQMEGEPAVASAIGNTYEEPAMPEPLPVASDVDVWGFTTKHRRKQTSRTTSKLPGLVLNADLTSPLPTSSEVHPGSTDGADYTAGFFCHAQLYVLADTYDIQTLKVLAGQRLSKAFQYSRRTVGSVANITGLIEYVFQHTPESDSQSDTLQDLCVHHAANSLETMMSSTDFRRLLRRGGLFVERLAGWVVERLDQL